MKVKILKFWASYCMPCKVMKPILDKFKEDNLELEVEEIDVEQNQELARQYEVRSIPHIIVFKDWVITNTWTWVADLDKLKELIA